MLPAPDSRRHWLLDRLLVFLLAVAAGAILLWLHGESRERLARQQSDAQRFAERAPDLQAEIFDLTGRIENALGGIDGGLRRGDEAGIAEAQRIFIEELSPLIEEWNTRKQLLRVEAAQVFGRRVSDALVDITDNSLIDDDCSVVVFASSPERGQNCTARRIAERDALAAEFDDAEWIVALLGRKDAGEDDFLAPPSFDRNLFILHHMISRYLRCLATRAELPADARSATICQDLDASRDILAFRLALVIAARQNIAEQLMEASAVR